MKQKIGIDFTYIIDDSVTGIRKYGEEIVDGLSKLNKKYEIVLFVYDALEDAFKKKFPNYKVIPIKFWFKDKRYIRRANVLNIAKKNIMKKQKCDIIIYPYVSKYTKIIKKQKKIVAILDVIPLDEIKNKNSLKYYTVRQEFIRTMNKSNVIVTISEYSKNRLLEINPNFNGEVIVIPSSVEKPKLNDRKVSEIIKTDGKYIFSINSFLKHKNQITLLKAFNRIKEQIQHKLVLVGRPESNVANSAYSNAIKYIEENNLQDRVIVLSYISDEDRNALFYNTDLFVTTSLQEGFGRTPVEAAICKVPVISTKETSLPEATMNEVFYYENATDDKELADKIMEVLKNKPSMEELEKIANKLEKEYSEGNIANKYVKLLDKVLNK